MKIFCAVTSKNGDRVPIEVADNATPTVLREQVAAATKIPLASLRLIFRGKMIKDDSGKKAIEEYKLEVDCVLHCMGKPVEKSANSTTTSVASGPAAATSVPVAAAAPPPPAAAASHTTAATSAGAAAGNRSVPAAILRLQQNNPPSVYQTALTTLEKILNNITSNPMEEKYRKVKRQNGAFQKRLGGLVGGHDCMLAVGFKVEIDGGVEVYQLHASPEQWPKLLQAKTEIEQAAVQAKQQAQHQSAAPFAAANTNAGNPLGAGFMPPGADAMPPLDPNSQQMMQQMLSNPDALRSAMQNPMMQEMIRNNPNVTPQMRSQFEAIASNPAMIEQVARQMQNPQAMAQMQAMMNARGAGMPGAMPNTGAFGGTSTAPAAGGGASQSSNNNAATGQGQGNDQNQTEDEMIAEAIRRSLEES